MSDTLDRFGCGYARLSKEGRILACNPTFCTWTKLKDQSEAEGVLIGSLFSPGSRLLMYSYVWPMLSIQGKAMEIAMELQGEDSDSGKVLVPVLADFVTHEEGGMEVAFFGNNSRRAYEQDLLAERKRATLAAEESRALLDSTPDAVLVVDGQGLVIDTNDLAKGLSPDALVGQHLNALIERKAGPEAPLWTKEQGVAKEELEVATRSDGVVYGLRSQQLPDGRTIVALRNLSTRLAMEAARQDAHEARVELKRLSELGEFKTEFIRHISHELRTPLTPMAIHLRTLKQLLPEEPAALKGLEKHVDRLREICTDLTDVVQLQFENAHLRPRWVDVKPILDQCETEAIRLLESKEVTFSTNNSVQRVWADAAALDRALRILVSNACKFTPQGSIQVHVTAADDATHFAVKDTGTGFSRDASRRLFQPFERVHDERANTARGTGVGLVLLKAIVELHGGRVGGKSEGEGKGAEFWFELPNQSR